MPEKYVNLVLEHGDVEILNSLLAIRIHFVQVADVNHLLGQNLLLQKCVNLFDILLLALDLADIRVWLHLVRLRVAHLNTIGLPQPKLNVHLFVVVVRDWGLLLAEALQKEKRVLSSSKFLRRHLTLSFGAEQLSKFCDFPIIS